MLYLPKNNIDFMENWVWVKFQFFFNVFVLLIIRIVLRILNFDLSRIQTWSNFFYQKPLLSWITEHFINVHWYRRIKIHFTESKNLKKSNNFHTKFQILLTYFNSKIKLCRDLIFTEYLYWNFQYNIWILFVLFIYILFNFFY